MTASQNLSDLITRGPIVYDRDRATEVAALFPDLSGEAKALISGVGGSSQYLAGVLIKEHLWLRDALKEPPEQAFKDLLEIKSEPDLSASLRVAKRRAALLIALADLGGVWSLDQVTLALSDLADRAIATALSSLVRAEYERGKLPMCAQADLATDCGMSVIGMGKLGARELNYSSDIDLIVLFDETRFDPDDYAAVRKTFVRVTQQLVKLLSEMTAEGYVFRTDLRLRPDPSVTPVCIAMIAAEHYYESLGRTWERAAMIKARPVAGDLAAGQGFLDRLKPFIWRRHLDFVAIQDAQDMLLKIRDHKGLGGQLVFPGHDMKLGVGGIREIEFFAQTHQLIFGGRDKSLRSSRTTGTLDRLASTDRITRDRADDLTSAYTAHRTLEHRIQMLDDAQTHLVPKSPEKLAQLANLCGYENALGLETETVARLIQVHKHTEIERVGDQAPALEKAAQDIGDLFDAREKAWFGLPALRGPRAREIYARLRPALMNGFAGVSHPETALIRFEQFLTGLPSGLQVFSLFEGTPILLDLIVDICAVSPALAEYSGRNKSVLDAVLDRDFFEVFPDNEALLSDLTGHLTEAGDYEQVLDAVRRWQKEAHFRNGVHLLRGISTPREAAEVYSVIADVSVSVLLPHVEAHLAKRFGPAPGRGMVILAMGKLGSREMTASSDLDLIVIYDADGATETSGPKVISVGAYFSRFTQALISALTVPTSEGSLYEVDMRLRPSGRNGPVATSLASFEEYQCNEAWTWEHLALTRARVVGGAQGLGSDTVTAMRKALDQPRDTRKTLNDVKEMREKLADVRGRDTTDIWETKQGQGRLLDIELCLQSGAILNGIHDTQLPARMIPALVSAGWLDKNDAKILAETHRLLSSVQQIERLVGEKFDPEKGGRRIEELICRVVDAQTVGEVMDRLTRFPRLCAAIIDKRMEVAD